jgi:hypothetical protein
VSNFILFLEKIKVFPLFLARWISDDPMFFRAAVDLHDELAKEEVRTVRNSHNSFL